jgi:DnaJ-class molecular chaperone
MEHSIDYYYNILEISEGSSMEDIKKARNKMALKWHPDRNKDNIEQANEKMKQINNAYEMLSQQKAKKIIYKSFHKYKQKQQINKFKDNVKTTFLNSKIKMINLKKTTKLLKPFNSFTSIIIDINNLIDNLSDDDFKLDIKILLDEIMILINDTNNVIWFKQFRNDNGIQLFYDLYVKYNQFNKYSRLQLLWHKILKYGNGFKYI